MLSEPIQRDNTFLEAVRTYLLAIYESRGDAIP